MKSKDHQLSPVPVAIRLANDRRESSSCFLFLFSFFLVGVRGGGGGGGPPGGFRSNDLPALHSRTVVEIKYL